MVLSAINGQNMSLLLDIDIDNSKDLEHFQSELPGHKIINWRADKGGNHDLSSVHYALVWQPDEGLLASLPNLEVIFSAGAGVDHIFADQQLPKDKPIVRFVDPDLRDRMSEWIVLQCLMHLRQQRRFDENQRSHEWIEYPQPIASQVRIGIMGLGVLGLDAAKKLNLLGFKVSGWARSKKDIAGIPTFRGESGMDAFLHQSDILVNLLPLTADTTGILDAGLFEKLPQDGAIKPVVINAGRGGSQIESDIVEALNTGLLGGVSLDVFQNEPLSKDSPLWDIENAILTPHIAAVSSLPALASYVVAMIKKFENGDGLKNLVVQSKGY